MRFLVAALGTWTGARAWMLLPEIEAEEPTVAARGSGQRLARNSATVRHALVNGPSSSSSGTNAGRRTGLRHAQPERVAGVWNIADLAGALGPEAPPHGTVARERPVTAAAAQPPLANPLVAAASREWEAQAYIYIRPSSRAAALAAGGQLGGSQVAARVAWRPGGGPVGLALRAYAPVGQKGAEAAAGIDWYPVQGVPLRISVERRQRIDRFGRSAWSAYAAGGFYKGGAPGRMEYDGYAQAGVVGTQRRDLFIDGALRAGYRLPFAKVAPIVGAAVWGAAQPQVSRIDIGPRAALRVPAGRHMVTMGIDGRFRIAGNAAPGSGAAFTIASDW